MPHAAEAATRDAIHRSGRIRLPPVSERTHDDPRAHVIGDLRDGLECAMVVHDPDRIPIVDRTGFWSRVKEAFGGG